MKTPPKIVFTGITRGTHREARDAELRYWAARTMRERLEAYWCLAEQHYNLPAAHVEERPTGITLHRIQRTPR